MSVLSIKVVTITAWYQASIMPPCAFSLLFQQPMKILNSFLKHKANDNQQPTAYTDNDWTQYTTQHRWKKTHTHTQMRNKTYDNENKNIASFKRRGRRSRGGILYIKRAKMFLIIVEMRSALKHNYPKWVVCWVVEEGQGKVFAWGREIESGKDFHNMKMKRQTMACVFVCVCLFYARCKW